MKQAWGGINMGSTQHTESERAEGAEMILIITLGLNFYFAAKTN